MQALRTLALTLAMPVLVAASWAVLLFDEGLQAFQHAAQRFGNGE